MFQSTWALQITALVILLYQICTAHDFFWDSDSDNNPDFIFQPNETLDFSPLNVSDADFSTEFIDDITHSPKKWIMGRVSRKHYAIPYMLWRKNQFFNDEINTPETDLTFERDIPNYSVSAEDSLTLLNTPKINISQKDVLHFLLTKFPVSQSQTTTVSDIEFYYLNENADKQYETKILEAPKLVTVNDCVCISNSRINTVPRLSLLINRPIYQGERLKTITDNYKINEKISVNFGPTATNNTSPRKTNPKTSSLNLGQNISHNTTHKINGKLSTKKILQFLTLKRIERDYTSSAFSKTTPPLKTQNDKIKFFEMYDSLTQAPEHNTGKDTIYNYEDSATNQHTKKHGIVERGITENVPTATESKSNVTNKQRQRHTINSITNSTITKTNISSRQETITENSLRDDFENISYQESMVWAKYPFTAVYVYEQFRVHCDAAAINPYWLLASAACLSRHREDPLGEDRSAFITYCGDSWWNPERINYVKSTQIHPKFHPKDTVRRHVYNVGVIQVVTSMASSCPNWAPVTIMSYQYNSQSDYSVGLAVGWGLDRYDTSFSSPNLPKRSMAVYKGLIYSNKCPGNNGYSITKMMSPEAAKYIYCLTLPLYEGESSDPIHGGLLLVGGKLIALYLQEERRHFGEQTAQYTGIWKVLPWVMENAKEPDEIDVFD